ncbi:MAG TPA: sugar phosphate isomerase/epimerase [Verrucomicrobiota bacterium]|nr:sugar phosphate isomerase/epimerase [Verrucomicrobiota bacterium]HNU50381.1 sugar phosphate isomerase/epimerase [Verrucomicrobiota bacterium]
MNPFSRRQFLRHAGSAALAAGAVSPLLQAVPPASNTRLHLASNQYSWSVFYGRAGRDFNADLDAGLADLVASGLDGYEPGVGSPADLDRLAPLLQRHRLGLRSLYVNSTLHTEADATQSIDQILAIAAKAKPLGTRIIVTNPNPLRWGGPENKDDAQLRTQAAALGRLGRQLAAQGQTLAYHNHDIELRQAAREFHHMMGGTDPDHVGLCLDAHWIWRGSGNSSVALFDIVRLYASRIRSLHLRQSEKGVWSETFGPGDIDYPALVELLRQRRVQPHLVLEIAVENGTPKTLDPVEAHRRSVEYAREILAPLG